MMGVAEWARGAGIKRFVQYFDGLRCEFDLYWILLDSTAAALPGNGNLLASGLYFLQNASERFLL